MKNLLTNFKNPNIWISVLFFLIWVKGCSTGSDIKSLKKEIIRLEAKNDSTNAQLVKAMQVEGLKSEKRMIQATDRKLLDVRRQTEIEEEIKVLNATK